MSDGLQTALAEALWDHEAIRVRVEEPFELASGNRSPIYVNCRMVVSSPDFMALFVAAARKVVQGVEFDAVAGGATAGIPYGAYLAADLNRPFLYVRKSVKAYGAGSQVEGTVEPGWRVLLVEDLITDGGSKLPFVDALLEAGTRVSDVLVLFDREQGGEAVLAERGVRLHALAGRVRTLEVGVARGALSPEAMDQVERYFEDPKTWHAERGFPFQGGA